MKATELKQLLNKINNLRKEKIEYQFGEKQMETINNIETILTTNCDKKDSR